MFLRHHPSDTGPHLANASLAMDPFYIDHSTGGSRQSRSQEASHLSSTASRLQDSNLEASSGRYDDQKSSATTSFVDSSNFITAPTQQYSHFPLLSEKATEPNWHFNTLATQQSGSAPLLSLDPAPQPPETPPRPNSIPTSNMSAIGIQQFDSRFDAAVRPSYTWPNFDMTVMGDQFLQSQMSPAISSGQLTPFDPKLVPLYARSFSSSPPRSNTLPMNLTPEQRELKRQRDHARRESKARLRRERSSSNPYSISQKSSPNLLARSVTDFPAPSPLLSQSSPSISNSSYLAPYTSPLMSDHGAADLYGTVYTMGPNDFPAVPAYTLPYSNAGAEPSMQAYARPHSHSSASDHSSIYPLHPSPKIASSDSADHVRVVHSRPKPQCWEHGCNGRQFSTFSNLLRHQREKSGQATKSSCPNCGAEFTRTTARNGHMAHEKCKQRRNS